MVKTEKEGRGSSPRYLVLWSNQEESGAELKTPCSIIRDIDMSDCSNMEYEVYRVVHGKPPAKLEIHECWYDPNDPLHIEVVDPDTGSVEFDGYGTDH